MGGGNVQRGKCPTFSSAWKILSGVFPRPGCGHIRKILRVKAPSPNCTLGKNFTPGISEPSDNFCEPLKKALPKLDLAKVLPSLFLP
jgi:hypothetical protein